MLVLRKDGSLRFCVDYRRANAVTQYSTYLLPRIDKHLDAMASSKYFSTLDLVRGYWQVSLTEDAKEKPASATRNGLWHWEVAAIWIDLGPGCLSTAYKKGAIWPPLENLATPSL